MNAIIAGVILASTVAMQQVSQPALDWTSIVVAFLTGAFGTNGISKIVDSFTNGNRVKKLSSKLEEMELLYETARVGEDSCKEQIAQLRRDMEAHAAAHERELAHLREEMSRRL